MKKYWILISIIILGATLRLYHFTAISLWHDEAFSALLIRYPWREMIYHIGLDVHPPAYYILLRLWHYLFGDAVWSLRGFSVFFGAATIPMAYALVKAAFKNPRAALWAALLVAINPFQIRYEADVRMYSMGALFALAAAYFLVKALDKDREQYSPLADTDAERSAGKKMFWHYALFAVCTSIIIYTHYYLLFTAAALMGYGLLHHIYYYRSQFRRYVWLAASYLAIIILYLPWIKTFLFQLHQVSASYWILPMTRWSIPGTLWQMLIGTITQVSHGPTLPWVLAAVLFCVFFLYRFIRRALAPHSWMVLLALAAPFIGAVSFELIVHFHDHSATVYLDRYFIFASLFFSIALAVWLESIRLGRLGLILLGAFCVINLVNFTYYWRSVDIKHNPGMAGAAAYLNANVEPGHKLIVASSFELFNFRYYNRTPVRPLLYSYGFTDTSAMPGYLGTAILTNEDLLPSLEAEHRGDTVWLLWTDGFHSSKPAVPVNWTQIDEKIYGDVEPNIGTRLGVAEYKVN
jgi:uncharacterized membrane protein